MAEPNRRSYTYSPAAGRLAILVSIARTPLRVLVKTVTAFGAAATAALTLGAWVLVYMNHAIASEIQTRAALVERESRLDSGMIAPVLAGRTVDDKPITVVTPSLPTLVAFYSPGCPHCAKTWPVWRALVNAMPPSTGVIFANTTTPQLTPETFYERFGVPDLGLRLFVDPSSQIAYRVRAVPQTVALRADGVISQVWVGELRMSQISEVLTALAPGTRNGSVRDRLATDPR